MASECLCLEQTHDKDGAFWSGNFLSAQGPRHNLPCFTFIIIGR